MIHTLLLTAITPAQQLLFPDLIAWKRDPDLMHNWEVDTEHQPGNWLLRFSVAIPNIGGGPFEVCENSYDVNSLRAQQGQASGHGSVYGDLSNSGGTVSPGNGPSTLPDVTEVVPELANWGLLFLAALVVALHRSSLRLGPARRST